MRETMLGNLPLSSENETGQQKREAIKFDNHQSVHLQSSGQCRASECMYSTAAFRT